MRPARRTEREWKSTGAGARREGRLERAGAEFLATAAARAQQRKRRHLPRSPDLSLSLSLFFFPGAWTPPRSFFFSTYMYRDRNLYVRDAAAASDLRGKPIPSLPLVQASCPINSHDHPLLTPSKTLAKTHRVTRAHRLDLAGVHAVHWSFPTLISILETFPSIDN